MALVAVLVSILKTYSASARAQSYASDEFALENSLYLASAVDHLQTFPNVASSIFRWACVVGYAPYLHGCGFDFHKTLSARRSDRLFHDLS